MTTKIKDLLPLPADAIINSHGRKLSPPDKQAWFQRDEVTAMVNAALEASRASATSAPEQPSLSGEVTDDENEQFSHDVSNFSGADPEATKYALEAFLSKRTATPQPAEGP